MYRIQVFPQGDDEYLLVVRVRSKDGSVGKDIKDRVPADQIRSEAAKSLDALRPSPAET